MTILKHGYFSKTIAAFIAICLLFCDLAGYAAPRLEVEGGRSKAEGFGILPPKLGTIEEFSPCPAPPAPCQTLYYIQDAHDSLEAQKNIAKIIQHFVEHQGIKTVFEEGYEGRVESDDYFGFIKNPAIREKVSYFLMDKLRISGAEYAHINRKHDFQLFGADDRKLHKANIQAYQKTVRHQKSILKELDAMQQEIQIMAHRAFPKEMKEWMKLKERFDNGEFSLFEYFHRMDEAAAVKNYLKTERDRKIFEYHKNLSLLKRFFKIQITPEEYQMVRGQVLGSVPVINTETIAAFIAREGGKSISLSRKWETRLKYATQFYELAHQRDQAIEKKLNSEKSILVFGGFHKNAIREMLKRKGYSYMIIAPRITKLEPRHQAYYQRLMSVGHHAFETPFQLAQAASPEHGYAWSGARAEIRAIYEQVKSSEHLPFPILSQEIEKRLASSPVNKNRSEMRGLYKNEEVKKMAEQIQNNWEQIKRGGAFVFDVEKTLADFLSPLPFEIAELLATLLRENVRVVIITGMPQELMRDYVLDPLSESVKNEPQLWKRLTIYSSGGGTKNRVDERGDLNPDPVYNKKHSLPAALIPLLQETLRDFALKQFHLGSETQIVVSEWRSWIKKKFPALHFDDSWAQGNKDWRPEIIDSGEFWRRSLRGGSSVTMPAIITTGRTNTGYSAVNIFHLPAKPRDIRPLIEAEILSQLSLVDKGSEIRTYAGGISAIDIVRAETNKAAALIDFIQDNNLNKKYIYYFGDQFYIKKQTDTHGQFRIIEGNDEAVASHPELAGITTLGVSEEAPLGSKLTLAIGRGIQTIPEFFSEIKEKTRAEMREEEEPKKVTRREILKSSLLASLVGSLKNEETKETPFDKKLPSKEWFQLTLSERSEMVLEKAMSDLPRGNLSSSQPFYAKPLMIEEGLDAVNSQLEALLPEAQSAWQEASRKIEANDPEWVEYRSQNQYQITPLNIKNPDIKYRSQPLAQDDPGLYLIHTLGTDGFVSRAMDEVLKRSGILNPLIEKWMRIESILRALPQRSLDPLRDNLSGQLTKLPENLRDLKLEALENLKRQRSQLLNLLSESEDMSTEGSEKAPSLARENINNRLSEIEHHLHALLLDDSTPQDELRQMKLQNDLEIQPVNLSLSERIRLIGGWNEEDRDLVNEITGADIQIQLEAANKIMVSIQLKEGVKITKSLLLDGNLASSNHPIYWVSDFIQTIKSKGLDNSIYQTAVRDSYWISLLFFLGSMFLPALPAPQKAFQFVSGFAAFLALINSFIKLRINSEIRRIVRLFNEELSSRVERSESRERKIEADQILKKLGFSYGLAAIQKYLERASMEEFAIDLAKKVEALTPRQQSWIHHFAFLQKDENAETNLRKIRLLASSEPENVLAALLRHGLSVKSRRTHLSQWLGMLANNSLGNPLLSFAARMLGQAPKSAMNPNHLVVERMNLKAHLRSLGHLSSSVDQLDKRLRKLEKQEPVRLPMMTIRLDDKFRWRAMQLDATTAEGGWYPEKDFDMIYHFPYRWLSANWEVIAKPFRQILLDKMQAAETKARQKIENGNPEWAAYYDERLMLIEEQSMEYWQTSFIDDQISKDLDPFILQISEPYIQEAVNQYRAIQSLSPEDFKDFREHWFEEEGLEGGGGKYTDPEIFKQKARSHVQNQVDEFEREIKRRKKEIAGFKSGRDADGFFKDAVWLDLRQSELEELEKQRFLFTNHLRNLLANPLRQLTFERSESRDATGFHNSQKFDSGGLNFKIDKRYVTHRDEDGSLTLTQEFRSILGRVNERELAVKAFDDFPVRAILNPQRAQRHSAWRTFEKSEACPLCAILKSEKENLLDVGYGFVMVPEMFPYFDLTGTVVRLEDQKPSIDEDFVRSTLQMLYELGPFGFRIGYNHKDAGEKIRHQSYKIFREPMPIENASSNIIVAYNGLKISRIEGFPTHGFIIEAHDYDQLANEMHRMESLMNLMAIPFNLLLTRRQDGLVRVFVELRSRRGEHPTAFKDKFFGVIEASGVVLFESRKDFEGQELKKHLERSYQEITPDVDTMDHIVHAYKAHAAVARIAEKFNLDYEIDARGSIFYVFRIPELGEVIKYFKLPGSPARPSYQWKDFFLQGFGIATQNLGEEGLFAPTQGADVDDAARFIPLKSGQNPVYVIQKIIEGPLAEERIQKALDAMDIPMAVQAVEKIVEYQARLIAVGVFDIDLTWDKILTNLRGEKALAGFDISHLRKIFGGVNIFENGGYSEDWAQIFEQWIDRVKDENPEFGMALKKRFLPFRWPSELTRLGLAFPTSQNVKGMPMKPWQSELIQISSSLAGISVNTSLKNRSELRNPLHRNRAQWIDYLQGLVKALPKGYEPTAVNVAKVSKGGVTAQQVWLALKHHRISYQDVGIVESRRGFAKRHSNAVLLIDADEIAVLTPDQKDELFSRLDQNQKTLRLVVFNDHGQVPHEDRALNAILKLARLVPESSYEVAVKKYGVLHGGNVLLTAEEVFQGVAGYLLKAVRLSERPGEIEFARRLAMNHGHLPELSGHNGFVEPSDSYLEDLVRAELRYQVVAYAA